MKIYFLAIFSLISISIFLYASYVIEKQAYPLQNKYALLKQKLEKTKQCNITLSDMVSNLSDPSADEYALITELGCIPEGYYKLIPQNYP